MSRWRETETKKGGSDDRPALEAVLAHLGVDVGSRVTGMTSCPLHNDRTPSLSYHLDKELWNCHSCGEGGDSYALLMKAKGVDFGRARELVTELGLTASGAGSSGRHVPGSPARFGGSKEVARRPGDRATGGSYRPSWRSD